MSYTKNDVRESEKKNKNNPQGEYNNYIMTDTIKSTAGPAECISPPLRGVRSTIAVRRVEKKSEREKRFTCLSGTGAMAF